MTKDLVKVRILRVVGGYSFAIGDIAELPARRVKTLLREKRVELVEDDASDERESVPDAPRKRGRPRRKSDGD